MLVFDYSRNLALKEIYETGKTKDKRYRSLPKGVLEGFVRTIIKMETLVDDLLRINHQCPGLHYERLKGSPYESVRIDKQYRILFQSEVNGSEIEITIIHLEEISNHYGEL